jgi:hypothetical protein
MKACMAALRLALILLLALAGDLAVPPLLEAMEGAEESEEIFHRARGHRPFRLVREAAAPSAIAHGRAVSEPSADRRPDPTIRPTPPMGSTRKTPATVADSAPASDDH